jgi:hypothetical protein
LILYQRSLILMFSADRLITTSYVGGPVSSLNNPAGVISPLAVSGQGSPPCGDWRQQTQNRARDSQRDGLVQMEQF